MSRRAKLFWLYWERFGILAILAAALVTFGFLTPRALAPDNLLTVLSRSAIVGIPALGMTFAICSGGFDLSAGSIVGLSTCIWAMLINLNLGSSLPFSGAIPAGAQPYVGLFVATLLTMALGAFCGVLNGLAITKLKIQTFVATLAMGMVFRGVALVVTDGSKQMISRQDNIEAKVFSQNYAAFGQQIQLVPLLAMVGAYAIGYMIYRHTRFGVYARAAGSHQPSARTSGLPVDLTLIMVFVVTGVTASMSSMITASQLMQGAATLGVGFELEVITATILGGTSLAGGKGNIWGSMVAAILLSLIRNGLNMLGLSEEYQRLAIGVILLLALAVSGVQELMKEARK